MTKKPLIALTAFALLFTTVHAQQSSSQSGIGVSVGIYLPTSAQIRTDLGNQALQFGLGNASTGRPSEGAISPEYTLIVANGNGNKLFIFPFTYGYEYHFGADSSATTLPYVRPFAGVAYYDYSITDFASAQHYSTKQLGATYGLEAGLRISNKVKISGTYNFFTQSNGFSFNGLSLAATYSLFSL